MKLSELRGLIEVDRNLGVVYPERPLQPFPHKGARGHSMERFAEFLSRLVFRRALAGDETAAFKVPKDKIFVAARDQSQEDQKVTGIGLLAGPYSYDEKTMYELGRPEADESTIDKYAPGTVLLGMGWYVEQFTLEAVAEHYATVRGILEGVRYAMRVFTDTGQMGLMVPAYFDRIAYFSIVPGDGYASDLVLDAAGRRIARLKIELWVAEVALVDYRRLRVILDFGPHGENIRDGNVYPSLG